MDENPYQPPQEVNEPDDEFVPKIPRIYHDMADGTVPVWRGLLIVRLTWIFVVIPALVLTAPVWGSVVAVRWMQGKPLRLTEKQKEAVRREWYEEQERRRASRQT